MDCPASSLKFALLPHVGAPLQPSSCPVLVPTTTVSEGEKSSNSNPAAFSQLKSFQFPKNPVHGKDHFSRSSTRVPVNVTLSNSCQMAPTNKAVKILQRGQQLEVLEHPIGPPQGPTDSIDLNKPIDSDYPLLSNSFAVLAQKKKSRPTISRPSGDSNPLVKSPRAQSSNSFEHVSNSLSSVAVSRPRPVPISDKGKNVKIDSSSEDEHQAIAQEAKETWELGQRLGLHSEENNDDITGRIENLIHQDLRNMKKNKSKGRKEKMRSSQKSR